MRSSTSNFELSPGAPAAVRNTAALQRRNLLIVAALLLLMLVGWELQMRQLGLRPGDLDDGPDDWVHERRKVDAGPRDSIVIIGDSRMLFGTDLDAFERMAGRRPIQLALPAANPQPFLRDLAEDPHFAGLLVIGTAENSFFRRGGARQAAALDYLPRQSPSQRAGHEIKKFLSGHLAFLDSNYTLFTLIERRDWPDRPQVDSPYKEVWKLSESGPDRQTWLWDRLGRDPVLRDHARGIWSQVYKPTPVPQDIVERVMDEATADVAKIRARGGEVVWIRPPSSGLILERERSRYPRAQVWDRLLRETGSWGWYFEDDPAMRERTLPDWSHLARADRVPFTEAYVRAMLERVEWLKQRTATGRQAAVGGPGS